MARSGGCASGDGRYRRSRGCAPLHLPRRLDCATPARSSLATWPISWSSIVSFASGRLTLEANLRSTVPGFQGPTVERTWEPWKFGDGGTLEPGDRLLSRGTHEA